jgi:hypothetical protein
MAVIDEGERSLIIVGTDQNEVRHHVVIVACTHPLSQRDR